MNFRKTSEGGGGVISDPKNYVALFLVKEKRNGHRFPGKSATLFSKNRVRGGVRGRLEVFRKFIKFGPGSLPLIRKPSRTGVPKAQFSLIGTQ